MPHRFFKWCLSLLAVTMPLWLLGCAAHTPLQTPLSNSQPLVSSGIDRPRLPKLVVVVDDAVFADLVYFLDDVKHAATHRLSDARYLGQRILLPPIITGKDNLERFLALVGKTLETGQVIAEADPEPRLRDHPVAQGAGGFAAGVSISVVPVGSIGAAIAEQSGALPPATKDFRIGKDIGQLVGGVGQIIVGCGSIGLGAGATSTGGGAPAGLVVASEGAALLVNGWANVCVASSDLIEITLRSGDEPAASTGSSSQPAATTSTPQQQPTQAKPAQTSTSSAAKANPSTSSTRPLVVCTGQWHHAITKKIYEELQKHGTLKNTYKYRDSRFMTQARDQQAHNGYDAWHRDMETQVIKWLKEHDTATSMEFEGWLREFYSRPANLVRFPNGL